MGYIHNLCSPAGQNSRVGSIPKLPFWFPSSRGPGCWGLQQLLYRGHRLLSPLPLSGSQATPTHAAVLVPMPLFRDYIMTSGKEAPSRDPRALDVT